MTILGPGNNNTRVRTQYYVNKENTDPHKGKHNRLSQFWV